MTALQLALIAGAICALGPILLLLRYAPRYPALGAYLEASSGAASSARPITSDGSASTLEDRLGYWVQRHAGHWVKAPELELELLGVPTHKYLAQRVLFAGVGLVLPAVLTAVLYAAGLRPPVAIPVVASLALAFGLSFVPLSNARGEAAKARTEFSFILGAYMDLVALERRAGSSPRQALEQAAEIGDSWVFRRLAEELAHSRLSGVMPWERLRVLGERYGVPELTELAHIMQIAGSESAGVYDTLKQRSKAMRKAHLARELTRANETSTRRSGPLALLGVVFMGLLIVPALLTVAGSL